MRNSVVLLLLCAAWVHTIQCVPVFTIDSIAGTGAPTFNLNPNGKGGAASEAAFSPLNLPTAVTFNVHTNSLIVADNGYGRLCSIDIHGKLATIFPTAVDVYPVGLWYNASSPISTCCHFQSLAALTSSYLWPVVYAIEPTFNLGMLRRIVLRTNSTSHFVSDADISGFWFWRFNTTLRLLDIAEGFPQPDPSDQDAVQPVKVTAIWVSPLDDGLWVFADAQLLLLHTDPDNQGALLRPLSFTAKAGNRSSEDLLADFYLNVSPVPALSMVLTDYCQALTGDTLGHMYLIIGYPETLDQDNDGLGPSLLVYNRTAATLQRLTQLLNPIYSTAFLPFDLSPIRAWGRYNMLWLPFDNGNDQGYTGLTDGDPARVGPNPFPNLPGGLVLSVGASLYIMMFASADWPSDLDVNMPSLVGPNPGFRDGPDSLIALAHALATNWLFNHSLTSALPDGIDEGTAYQSIFIADHYNNRIRAMAFDVTDGPSPQLRTVAGVTSGGYTGDGLAVSQALYLPCGLDLNPNPPSAGSSAGIPEIMFLDVGNFLLRRLTPRGDVMTVLGQPGVGSSQLFNALGTEDAFAPPRFTAHVFAVDWWRGPFNAAASGFGSDDSYRAIYFVDNLGLISVCLGRRFYALYAIGLHDDSVATQTTQMLRFDRAGVLWAMVSASNGFSMQLLSAEIPMPSGLDGTPSDFTLTFVCRVGCPRNISEPYDPTALRTFRLSHGFVTFRFDDDNQVVLLVTKTITVGQWSTGKAVTVWRDVTDDDDISSFADLVVSATDGLFYLMDGQGCSSHRVFLAELGSQTARRVAGTHILGYAGDGGPALHASLYAGGAGTGAVNPVHCPRYSAQLAEAGGVLYVADSLNNRIRRLTPHASPSAGGSETLVAIVVPAVLGVAFLAAVLFGVYRRRVRKQIAELQETLRLAQQNSLFSIKLLSLTTAKDIAVTYIEKRDVETEEVVGRGAFADVYKARWRGGTVAFKLIRVQQTTPQVAAEFENEFLVSAHLGNHPCVVPFLGGCLAPQSFLVFNFITHGSMEQLLIEGGKFLIVPTGSALHVDNHIELISNLASVLQMLVDAAAGILHCHAKHIIHRDISARNFLVDPFNRVSVCDFGLARFLPPGVNVAQAPAGELLPLAWAAPEMLSHRHLSEQTDVYAFGVFLHEVVTRGEPYPGMHPLEVAKEVCLGLPPLRPVIPGYCPTQLDTLMRQCWRAEADERPTMTFVLESLRAFYTLLSAAVEVFRKSDQSPQAVSRLSRVYEPSDASAPLSSMFRVSRADAGGASENERRYYHQYAPSTVDNGPALRFAPSLPTTTLHKRVLPTGRDDVEMHSTNGANSGHYYVALRDDA